MNCNGNCGRTQVRRTERTTGAQASCLPRCEATSNCEILDRSFVLAGGGRLLLVPVQSVLSVCSVVRGAQVNHGIHGGHGEGTDKTAGGSAIG